MRMVKSNRQYGRQVFNGFEDLTTKVLEQLKGHSTVSRQFIFDLINSPDLKLAERELIRETLWEEKDTVDVNQFAHKIRAELLDLEKVSLGFGNNMSDPGYESITLPDNLRGNVKNYCEHIYTSRIETTAGDVHFETHAIDNYFAHTRIEDLDYGEHVRGGLSYAEDMLKLAKSNHKWALGKGTKYDREKYVREVKKFSRQVEVESKLREARKTRRVIEVQSDLFQKGRIEREYSEYMPARQLAEEYGWYKKGTTELRRDISDYNKAAYQRALDKENELKQLDSYRNIWHERIIKEEIKQAAKDGKTRLQFPTGETAMKIEGLGETHCWYLRPDNIAHQLGDQLTPYNLRVGQMITRTYGENWVITEILGGDIFKAVPENSVVNEEDIRHATPQTRKHYCQLGHDYYITNDAEEFDISGKIDTYNPIYRFYEKEIGKYLTNKYGAKKIKDEPRVEWWEIQVSKEMARRPIEVFSTEPVLNRHIQSITSQEIDEIEKRQNEMRELREHKQQNKSRDLGR